MITAPELATPEWLTSVLRRDGRYGDLEVSRIQVILSKELQVSTVHRIEVEYDGAVKGPPTLFLKLCGPVRDQTEIARAEVRFYREIAPRLSCPPLIQCFDAAFDEPTGRSHILLEDLTETHTQPEQMTAPSVAMSRRAIATLAAIHAEGWSIDDITVFDDAWLEKFIDDLHRNVTDFLAVADATPKQIDAYGRMLDAAPRIWGRLSQRQGLTVTHGDMHWWNFLLPKDIANDSVRVFDWHLWHIDLGARDLAFLLALGGFAEPRPQIEEELLRVYHDALGIEDYSWEELNLDYRTSAIRNLNIPVIFWKQGKHHTTWQTALRRAWESYERLDCASLDG